MDEICESFDRFRTSRHGGCTEGERRHFEEHLANCPACHEQWTVDRILGNLFSEIPQPVLSPAFDGELRRRLSEGRRMRHGGPFLMQVYWLAACVVSLLIFVFSGEQYTRSGTTLLLLLLCFVVPTLLLGKVFRFSLFDLILSTMNHPEKRVDS